ncbi:MAG: universal stress protein [Bryobacteraceae bacterium]|jgi:nucleotide-binding universal stress UspA family protein
MPTNTSKIRHILFPLDFSAAGMAAIPYVRALANQFHAQVTVLSVVPPAWVTPPGLIPPPVGSDPVALQNALQAHLDKLAIDGFESPPARLTALGDPAVKIAEFSRDNRADLVMLPTHGHGLFRGLLLGSVTSKVLHDVHCPVWTAAHAQKQHAQEAPRKILCALDGADRSLALAQWAFEFSRQVGASLQFLHVVRTISDWLALESEQALQEELRTEARNRIEGMLKSGLKPAGMDLPLRIAVGEIVTTITEEARQEGADLIVLGRGPMHETLGRLRTHAHGIIQRSPCPVLSV